jgi:hypothetical protein
LLKKIIRQSLFFSKEKDPRKLSRNVLHVKEK